MSLLYISLPVFFMSIIWFILFIIENKKSREKQNKKLRKIYLILAILKIIISIIFICVWIYQKKTPIQIISKQIIEERKDSTLLLKKCDNLVDKIAEKSEDKELKTQYENFKSDIAKNVDNILKSKISEGGDIKKKIEDVQYPLINMCKSIANSNL